MSKWKLMWTALVSAMLLAPSAFAQGGAEAGSSQNHGALWIAAGFGMAIAALGGALGQGRIGAAACEGIARNPGAAKNIQTAMILGLVFIETLALLTLVIIFTKVK